MRRIGLYVPVLVLLLTGIVYADQKAVVAVAAVGNTPAAEVSGVAARSPYFLILDGDGALLEVVDNPYLDAGKGAGPSVARLLAQKGVTLVVAGEFGRNMIRALTERNMKYLEFQGSAEAAWKKLSEAAH